MDKISIIIPVYRVKEEYLIKCLESVKNQTYNSIEVIVICDGSPKNIIDICNSYSDNRFTIIDKQNTGVSDSRNIGIKTSTGKYIAFVDSDDWLELSFCETMIENIGDSDIAISRTFIEYEGSNDVRESTFNIDNYKNQKEEIMKSILVDCSSYRYVDTPWAKMYVREFLINNSIKFDIELKMGEDGLFNFESYYLAESIKVIDKPLYHYRKNNDSVCGTFHCDLDKRFELVFNKYTKLNEKYNFDNHGYSFNDEFSHYKIRQLDNLCKRYFFNSKNIRKSRKELFRFVDKNISFVKIRGISFKRSILLLLVKLRLYHVLELIYKRR